MNIALQLFSTSLAMIFVITFGFYLLHRFVEKRAS